MVYLHSYLLSFTFHFSHLSLFFQRYQILNFSLALSAAFGVEISSLPRSRHATKGKTTKDGKACWNMQHSAPTGAEV